MELGQLRLRVEFPDAAGAHQRARSTASLIRELGDNYDRYHAFLARALGEIGDRPEPRDYGDDLDSYARDCQRIDDLMRAEAVLRACWRYRQRGESLGSLGSEPMVDTSHRLLNVRTGEPSGEQPASEKARAWRPPKMPD
jgi:hypothetical protein